jgi:cellulose synthase/poly-beta-1,6-N-acetylglucosamine synthase-like glycosyltransferase
VASFLTCSVKASAADMIAQSQQEAPEEESPSSSSAAAQVESETTIIPDVDVSRNLGFLLYGGLYTGIAQNFLYTVLFPAWFGTEETLSTIIQQVMADNFIFAPLVCLPVGYCFKTAFGSDDGFNLETLSSVKGKYLEDILEKGLLLKYWSIWMPAQFMTFSIIPPHFRVLFVATISFFWFFLLSKISSAEEEGDNAGET